MRRSTFEELLECARQAGIPVRHAALGGSGGGMALVKGKGQLFVDTDAEPEDQLDRTVDALARHPQIEVEKLRADVANLLRFRREELATK
jgi:hypothetical protein